ncbi:MAG: hypothetical protein R2757_09090 [Draconibacterium sp.]
MFKLRDGPSWKARGDPRWYARGKPPAGSEPDDDDWNVIPITEPLISPRLGGACPAFRQRVSRQVGTEGLNVIQNDQDLVANSAPDRGVRRTLCMLFLTGNLPPNGGKPSRKNRWNQ